MNLNRSELRKILYDFNSYSNRLLQANCEDYIDVLGKFLKYIDATPIINDYINGYGRCALNLETEVQKVKSSYGRCVFSVGDTVEEEVPSVYTVLRYLVDNNISVRSTIFLGYSSSKQYQDKIKGFNERFVMVLIRHVEGYLTKVGIDMGIDEKNTYNVTVQNGQAIIANDNSTVNSTAYFGMNADELRKMISDVREAANSLESTEDKETTAESLEVIETEVVAEKPKKSMIKTAIAGLKAIKGTAEFGSAVAVLIQFIETII